MAHRNVRRLWNRGLTGHSRRSRAARRVPDTPGLRSRVALPRSNAKPHRITAIPAAMAKPKELSAQVAYWAELELWCLAQTSNEGNGQREHRQEGDAGGEALHERAALVRKVVKQPPPRLEGLTVPVPAGVRPETASRARSAG